MKKKSPCTQFFMEYMKKILHACSFIKQVRVLQWDLDESNIDWFVMESSRSGTCISRRRKNEENYWILRLFMIFFIDQFLFIFYRIAEDFPKITNPSRQDKKHFQNRKEKSTGILVGIVLVFFFCHILRVSIQVSVKHGLDYNYYKLISPLTAEDIWL